MDGNPFSMLVTKIRDEVLKTLPASSRLGTVIKVEPLTVNVAGTMQDKDSLLKNESIISFFAGDRLLLIPIEDEQRYIILCKVVDV
jgi:hypothetical protein